MLALLVTLQTISVELEALARDHPGKFTYFGDSDLGFPRMASKQSKY